MPCLFLFWLQAHISGVGSSSCLAESSQNSLLSTLTVPTVLNPLSRGNPLPLPSKTNSAALAPTCWMKRTCLFLAPPRSTYHHPTTITILILCQGLSVVPSTVPRVLRVLSDLHQLPYYKCHYCSHLTHKDTEALRGWCLKSLSW